MKKILSFLIIFIVFFIPVNVYADDASVNIEVVGKVEKGSTIEILVNLKGVENFYAASVDFTYNTSQLKVESIIATEFITKHANDIMELGGESNKNGNTASYSFTFLGDSNGINGAGTLVKITANVLNNEKLSINQENMKIKLVHRVEDTVENYSYSFSGYDYKATTNVTSDSINSNSNGSNSNNKEQASGNESENSSINTGNINNSTSSNDNVDSNKINDSSSDIEGQDNNFNSDNEELANENAEKYERQIADTQNESNNNEEDKNEGTSSNKTITLLMYFGIVLTIGVIGYYLYSFKKYKVIKK